MYVNKKTKEVLKKKDIKPLFPKVSFPASGPSKQWLEDNGYALLVESPAPEVGPDQIAVENGVEKVGGEFQTKWLVREKTKDEKDFEEEEYKRNRQSELKALDGEGMDAMRKAIEEIYEKSNAPFPPEYEEYRNKVYEVKSRHPKER